MKASLFVSVSSKARLFPKKIYVHVGHSKNSDWPWSSHAHVGRCRSSILYIWAKSRKWSYLNHQRKGNLKNIADQSTKMCFFTTNIRCAKHKVTFGIELVYALDYTYAEVWFHVPTVKKKFSFSVRRCLSINYKYIYELYIRLIPHSQQ